MKRYTSDMGEYTPEDADLPEKLSGLITCALDDMDSLDRDEYVPVAREYHHRRGGVGPTRVCLAGALMAGSLGANVNETKTPFRYAAAPEGPRNAILALNWARQGRIVEALVELSPEYQAAEETYPQAEARIESEMSEDELEVVRRWRRAPPIWSNFMGWVYYDRFAPNMRQMAADLAAVGR